MNFDFPDELKQLREEARRFLGAECPLPVVRQALDERQEPARKLWRQMADLGWLGVTIAPDCGGVGLGDEALCVIAEELGRAVAPVPFASSVCLATAAISDHASPAQKAQWLPALADGTQIGCLALMEGVGQPHASGVEATVRNGRLSATKWPVLDGDLADFAIVVARDADGSMGLFRVDLQGPGVQRTRLDSLDPTLGQARLVFEQAPAIALGECPCGWPAIETLIDRAAVPLAFAQVGGAQACLEMAKQYALERYAFGRPIGSFQAIKHKLADVFVAIELARSNAYYAAWAISTHASETTLAAATAHLSASEAYQLAARENIQTHGGLGCTWEYDCHFHYRRAKLQAVLLGGAPFWRDRLLSHLPAPATA